jgi:vanillate O-demethylase monooxygenase subunit
MANKRTPNLDLKIDVGPLRYRRNLANLIAAENQKLAAAE